MTTELSTQRATAAHLYLARLSSGSRRAQAQALRVLAGLLAPGLELDPADVPWQAVLPEHAVALRARLAHDYAPATARRILAAFRGVLEESWRLGLLDGERKARLLDLPPVRGSRPPAGRALRPEEIASLYAATDNARDRALLGVLLQGGLRREEAAHLTWQDVRQMPGPAGDPARTAGPVPHKGYGPQSGPGDALALTVQGKGHKVRTVYLAGRASHDLATYMEVSNAQRSKRSALVDPSPATEGAGGGPPGSPEAASREPAHGLRLHRRPGDRPVPIPDGSAHLFGLVSGAAVGKALARLCVRAGVRCSPHDLRRTYASCALDAGVDLATVQASLGHADPRTTARYDRRGADALRRAAETIARASE
jgi:integrase/recombinase XerD